MKATEPEQPILGVQEYADAQLEAVKRYPLWLTQAFQPVSFDELGYQTRITGASELWKYIDSMSQPWARRELAKPHGALTPKEFELCQVIARQVLEYGERFFSKRPHSAYTTIRSSYVLRNIRYIYGARPVRILEIGPGCGYLGAMLISEGYPYAATDVSAGLYLHQNRFWSYISGGRVKEIVRDNADRTLERGSALHIPWWEFVALRPETFEGFDVVICNHALCEMSPASLRFNLQLARELLRDGDALKLFMFAGWGGPIAGDPVSVTKAFSRAGFSLVHNHADQEAITVFAPTGSPSAGHSATSAFRKLNPTILKLALRRLGGLKGGYRFPDSYSSDKNPISRAILEGERLDASQRTLRFEEVRRFYRDLLGADDGFDPDLAWARANFRSSELVGAVGEA